MLKSNDGAYMAISYGTPENRVLHYKRPNLKFNISTFEIAPEGKKSQDSVSIKSNQPNLGALCVRM